MKTSFRSLFVACAAIMSVHSATALAIGRDKEQMLDRLDEVIADRGQTIKLHEAKIELLKRSLREIPESKPQYLRERYDITSQLVDCYFSYQSDSTLRYLHQNMELARRLGDNNLIVRTSATLSHRFSLSGRLFDADRILSELKDTLRLDATTRLMYCNAQNRKFRELAVQARADGLYELSRSFKESELYYARQAAKASPDQLNYWYFRSMEALCQNDWMEALSMCDSVLVRCSSDSHDFARSANHKAQIFQNLGRDEEALEWYIHSATADFSSAVRDYGSLGAISEYLFEFNDVERAMRYIRVSISDSQFYNSPKRSWSDMNILPQIERAYYERNQRLQLVYAVLTAVALLFSVTLVSGFMSIVRRNRKLKRIQEMLRASNQRLSLQNRRITDANRIKEAYIGGFLMIISEYIDKLARTYTYVAKMLRNNQAAQLQKEYAGSNIRNNEIKEFYAIFDKMFLNLFPNFIEQFNALLNEENALAARSDETLTTELRIYALIRLGITDTATIASLLHCSVSTVYNYRSAIRRHARESVTDFDHQIQQIGLPELSADHTEKTKSNKG